MIRAFILAGMVLATINNGISQIEEVQLTFTATDGTTTIANTAQSGDTLMGQAFDLPESTEFLLDVDLTNAQADYEAKKDLIRIYFAPNFDLISHSVDPLDLDSQELPVGFENDFTTNCTNETMVTSLELTLVEFESAQAKQMQDLAQSDTVITVSWPVTLVRSPDAPPCENEEELITDVFLTWTSETDTVVARASDPDGEGPLDIEIVDKIVLSENTTYQLDLMVTNELEGEDITEEIRGEGDEHMFFFAFSENIFSDPEGDGNIDQRNDPLNYLDEDENGLPIGLSTQWTTSMEMNSGTFRLVLKHQPDSKDSVSTSETGGTDIDLTFDIENMTTSSNDLFLNSTRINTYPNPAQEFISIDGLESESILSIEIFNLQGQVLISMREPQSKTINISKLQAQPYVIKVRTGEGAFHATFIKTK